MLSEPPEPARTLSWARGRYQLVQQRRKNATTEKNDEGAFQTEEGYLLKKL